MAFIKLNIPSSTLGWSTEVYVLYPLDLNAKHLPENYLPLEGFPVLYLHHGGTNNYTDWLLNSTLCRTARRKGLMLVLSTVEDQLSGRPWRGDFLRFAGEELPDYINALFPVSHRREDTFVGGLSYGGYFSYRLAFCYPERFGAVGSLSSPLNVARDVKYLHPDSHEYPDWTDIIDSNRDILHLARTLKVSGRPLPRLYQACGTEDFTWALNQDARAVFTDLGYDHTWEQGAGTHDFDFWEPFGQRFLNWLPLTDQLIDQPPFRPDQIGV